jgi:hypothetical protein
LELVLVINEPLSEVVFSVEHGQLSGVAVGQLSGVVVGQLSGVVVGQLSGVVVGQLSGVVVGPSIRVMLSLSWPCGFEQMTVILLLLSTKILLASLT